MTHTGYDDLRALFITTFMTWNLLHLARMLKDAAESPRTATSAASGTPAAGSTSRTRNTGDTMPTALDIRPAERSPLTGLAARVRFMSQAERAPARTATLPPDDVVVARPARR